MGIQQHRKHPLPVVRAAHGHGIFLLAHRKPQDPCPVPGCRGTLLFLHQCGPAFVVCSVQPAQHGRPSPWGEEATWWRPSDRQSPYKSAVSFRAAESQEARETARL
jgi:hypothetical protein